MDANFIFIILAAGLLLLAIWIFSFELRLKRIFKGEKVKNLENVIVSFANELKELNKKQENIEKYLETAEKRLKQSIQQVGVVRFNPFEDTGSNQSFVISLLNEKGNGVALSSFYSRETVRIYAKPINNYNSEYSLSKEEQEAINKARGDIKHEG
jgi:septal ring factor EnvC (AmiA/AmiB activator)